MTNFFKGVGSAAIVLIVSMAIHVFCNMKGISLDTVVTTVVSASFATLIYHVWTKNKDQ